MFRCVTEGLESDTFDLTTVVSVVPTDAVGVVGVVVSQNHFVGRAKVLKTVFQPFRELVARRDIPGERFPSIAFGEFIVVLEEFRRRHLDGCVVHIGHRPSW